jgi:oligopeptide transport system substrate-binding protein
MFFSQPLFPLPILHAQDNTVTVVAHYQADTEVVLHLAGGYLGELDPQQMYDVPSIANGENLFHGLTDYDPVTHAVVPELATEWEISDDGIVWTFHLRDDVLWYRYNPDTDLAEKLRPVVAGDVVYGIKRSCDSRLGAYYSAISASVIAGCDIVYNTSGGATTDSLVFGNTTKVSAPDDTTVVIELQFAAGYFLSMTPMWMLRPVHRETIDQYGSEWTTPGNITTNGPFFIDTVSSNNTYAFVRNPEHNPALEYGGNIDRIEFTSAGVQESFPLYQDNLLDATDIPPSAIQRVLEDSSIQTELHPNMVSFVRFMVYSTAPPFDNVHVRRAISAIIDRELFIERYYPRQGIPMIHFTPPGITYAPPINRVGVGFDPAYALEEMALAGYPNCEGFPLVDFGAYHDFIMNAAHEYLGCSIYDLSDSTHSAFSIMWQGWAADYSDANNYVGDFLGCQTDWEIRTTCTEVDSLIEQAARSNDPEEREQLYIEIEESFFGKNGEFPILPLYVDFTYFLAKPWFTGPHDTDGLFGAKHWDAYSVDMAAKLAARNQ